MPKGGDGTLAIPVAPKLDTYLPSGTAFNQNGGAWYTPEELASGQQAYLNDMSNFNSFVNQNMGNYVNQYNTAMSDLNKQIDRYGVMQKINQEMNAPSNVKIPTYGNSAISTVSSPTRGLSYKPMYEYVNDYYRGMLGG